jgi:hypothetical protein
VVVDPTGTLYIADYYNHRVRKVQSGVITTVAGNGGVGSGGSGGDGGPATSAQLDHPVEIAVGGDGILYIPDVGVRNVRRVDRSGVISTYVK